MIDTDPPRCPRCGSHDVTVLVIDNDVHGSRLRLTCDQCASTTQHRMVRRPAGVAR